MQRFHLTFSLRHRPSTEALLRKLAKSLDYVTGKFCFNTERRKCTSPQTFLHYPLLVNATHSLLPFKRRNTIWNGRHPPELRLTGAWTSFSTSFPFIFSCWLCRWTLILITCLQRYNGSWPSTSSGTSFWEEWQKMDATSTNLPESAQALPLIHWK